MKSQRSDTTKQGPNLVVPLTKQHSYISMLPNFPILHYCSIFCIFHFAILTRRMLGIYTVEISLIFLPISRRKTEFFLAKCACRYVSCKKWNLFLTDSHPRNGVTPLPVLPLDPQKYRDSDFFYSNFSNSMTVNSSGFLLNIYKSFENVPENFDNPKSSGKNQ